jgi:peroxiredoxin
LTTEGSTDDLYLGTGEGGRFTLDVFYRGLHGLGRVVAVSIESAERSTEVVERGRLTRLPVAYGLTDDDAREWGQSISTAIKEHEPSRFSEPRIFILDAHGTVANEHDYLARRAA